MHIEGEAVYIDLNDERHSIEGVGSFSDNTALKSLKVSGELTFKEITCDELKIEGEGSGTSAITKNFSVSGSIEIDSVEVEEIFKVSGSTEIKKLNAKKIIMESRDGSIGEIKCDEICIYHEEIPRTTLLSKILRPHKSRVRIKRIDGGKVELENCEVEEINCHDAFIRANCVIKKIVFDGECEIDDINSQVAEPIYKNS